SAVERYSYGDFGKPHFFDGLGNPIGATAIANPFLFEALRFDAELGFYLVGKRQLDPRAGCFVQRKASGGGAGEAFGGACTSAADTPLPGWSSQALGEQPVHAPPAIGGGDTAFAIPVTAQDPPPCKPRKAKYKFDETSEWFDPAVSGGSKV